MRWVVLACLMALSAGCLDDARVAPMGHGGAEAVVAAPGWQVGDWWTYAFHHVSSGNHHEITVVVADIVDGVAKVGVAAPDGIAPDAFHMALIAHVPFIGEVEMATGSWLVHDRTFEPLQFPLATDQTWTTRWMSGDELDMTVTGADPAGAHITSTGPWRMDIDYDAGAEAIRTLVIQGYASMHLQAHGRGHVGDVMVPENLAMIWYEDRHVVTADRDGGHAAPTETLAMPAGYDRITFALITGQTAYDGVLLPAGAFRIDVSAPDGTSWSQDASGVGQGRPLTVHHHAAVAGDWELQMTAVGTGRAGMEAFAYQETLVTLP